MITLLHSLFWADVIAIRRYFAEQTLSKVVIAGLFGAMTGVVIRFLFQASWWFFNYLSQFEQFGSLTAEYILHAAIVVIAWIGVCSGVVATSGLVSAANTNLSLLLSLPLSSRTLASFFLSKTICANASLLLIILTPIVWAYGLAFQQVSLIFLFKIGLVISLLSMFTSSLGMLIGLPLVKYLKGREYWFGLGGLALCFLCMVALIKTVFPPQLSQLQRVSPTEFDQVYTRLPLNHPVMPSRLLAQLLTQDVVTSVWQTLLFAGSLVLGSWLWLGKQFRPIVLIAHSASRHTTITKWWQSYLQTTQVPLMVKDALAIWRNPSEMGYGGFLFSLASFFFVFLALGTKGAYFRPHWQMNLIIFTLVWLLFFATALLIRFAFPLMAKEGQAAWWLFSAPFKRTSVLHAKLGITLVMSLPVWGLAGVLWMWMPFTQTSWVLLTGYSLLGLSFLAITLTLLGSILPNFTHSSDPEKISSSGMGLVALGVAALYAGYLSFVVQIVLAHPATSWLALATTMSLGLGTTGLLYYVARLAMKRYQW